MSSIWALAKAAASAATDSLERCMASLRSEHIERHRAGFRAPSAYPMSDCFLGILGHQGLELAFRPFVVEKGISGIAKQAGEFRPGVRRAHINDANGLD